MVDPLARTQMIRSYVALAVQASSDLSQISIVNGFNYFQQKTCIPNSKLQL